jgi:hypothetical protein
MEQTKVDWHAAEIIVPSDPEYFGVCITSPTRPGAWHAWLRAGTNTLKDLGWPFLLRLEVHAQCGAISTLAFDGMKKPPRRAINPFSMRGIPGKL